MEQAVSGAWRVLFTSDSGTSARGFLSVPPVTLLGMLEPQSKPFTKRLRAHARHRMGSVKGTGLSMTWLD